MGDDREFEEARERTSGVETVRSQDPPNKSNDYEILSLKASYSAFPVHTTDDKDSAQKFAGITQFSNVMGMVLLHSVFKT